MHGRRLRDSAMLLSLISLMAGGFASRQLSRTQEAPLAWEATQEFPVQYR